MASFLSSASSWLTRSQVLSNYAIQDAPSASTSSSSYSSSQRYSSQAQSSSGTAVKIGLWTVSPAKHRSSGKPASVWSYEKSSAPSSSSSRRGASAVEGAIIEALKAEVSKLTRMRMPCVLEVVEPLEETRSGLIWASEPVTCSLRAALAASSTSSRERLDAYHLELDEVELQKGLLQISKALQFLHDSARIVHGNLTPDAVVISTKGDWKLSALHFSRPIGTAQDSNLSFDVVDSSLPQYVQPNLDYAAPELVLDREALAPPADLWSLGCVCHALLVKGARPPLQNKASRSVYKSNIDRLDMARAGWASLGDEISGLLNALLQRVPSRRPSSSNLPSTCSYFNSILVSTLRFLDRDNFPSKSTSEQLSFLRGLKSVLPQFSDRVRQRRILPALLEQGLGKGMRRELVPVLLPNIFYLADSREALSMVLPHLKQLFVLSPSDSPECALALLEYMPTLQAKCGRDMFKTDVGPFLLGLLSASHPPLVIRALQTIPPLCNDNNGSSSATFDYVTVRDVLFPKIAEVFSKTTMLGIKVAGLISLGGLVPVLDKRTLTEKLVPLLSKIKTKEPSVLLSALTIFQLLSTRLTDPVLISTLILPQLWVMSAAPQLNEGQYSKFMSLIDTLANNVRTERLQELRASAKAHEGVEQKDASSLTWEELVRGQSNAPNGQAAVAGASPSTSTMPDLFGDSLAPDVDPSFSVISSRPATPMSDRARSPTSMTPKKPLMGAKPVPSSSFNSSAFIAPPMEPMRPMHTGSSTSAAPSAASPSPPLSASGPNYSSFSVPPPPPPSSSNVMSSSTSTAVGDSGSSTAGWRPTAPLLPSSSSSLSRPASHSQPMLPQVAAPASNGLMQPMKPAQSSTSTKPKAPANWGDFDPLS